MINTKVTNLLVKPGNYNDLYTTMQCAETGSNYTKQVKIANCEYDNSIKQLLEILKKLFDCCSGKSQHLDDEKLAKMGNFLEIDAGELIEVAQNCLNRMVKLEKLPIDNWGNLSFEKVVSENRIQIRKLFDNLVGMTSVGELCDDQGIRVLQVENLVDQVFDGNGVLELDKLQRVQKVVKF